MDQPRLRINDKEIGLRHVGDGLYEPKNLSIFEKVFHNEYVPNDEGFFTIRHFPKEEPEKYHKIESFCFVATENIKEEAELLLRSLREFHDQPVYVICDKETREHIKKQKLHKNVIFKTCAEQEHLDKINEKVFKNHSCVANNIHNPSAIFKKMDVMDFALESHSNTFFLDADIIVLDSLQEYFTSLVVLSPHYYPKEKGHKGFEFGFYNAGYIFCASRGFPRFWKHIYLNDSTFFEQEGMNRIPDYYKIQTFDQEHNVGFWRGEKLPKKAKSVHAHITSGVDANRNEKIINLNTRIKNYAIDQTEKQRSPLLENLAVGEDGPYSSTANNVNSYIKKYYNPIAKQKLAFIHFGKTGGVYVNHYLRAYVMPFARNFNSWKNENTGESSNLRRDWTKEELLEIAEEDTGMSLAHNHHLGWCEETVRAFKDNGWLTFMFLRDPKDLICSLYFFSKKILKKRGVTAIGPNGVLAGLQDPTAFEPLDVNSLALDSFFSKMVNYENQHIFWKLPSYISLINYVAQFNDKNFGDFLFKCFGHIYTPKEKLNTTENKGFKFYYAKGLISEKSKELIESHPEYIKYSEYL